MNASWKQIYPRDCYRILLKLSGETGLSFPKLVNVVVREGLIALGYLPENTSQKYLLKPTPVVAAEEQKQQKQENDEERVKNFLEDALSRKWKDISAWMRANYILEALKYQQLECAKKVLEIADKKEVELMQRLIDKYGDHAPMIASYMLKECDEQNAIREL